MIAFGTLILAFATQTLAVKSWGRCPSPTLQSGFDISQYVGTWYEIARDKNIQFEYGDCVQARYAELPDGKISVHNSLENPNTGSVDSAYASAKCKGAHCHIKFFLFYSGDYRVISTDYTSFAIVYSCFDLLFGKSENVWILSRTQSLSSAALTAAQNIITTSTAYSLDNLYYTVQGGSCAYFS